MTISTGGDEVRMIVDGDGNLYLGGVALTREGLFEALAMGCCRPRSENRHDGRGVMDPRCRGLPDSSVKYKINCSVK